MKKLIIAAVLIVFGFSANVDANANYAKKVGGYFYSSLSPHGTWIEIGFGTPVWRPTMIRKSWAPYRQGQWIYTDYGWYWDSYESFGHIVYHYGRWYFDDFYGWIWIPDNEWAPAWVDWRYDDDYIGWAPLSPYALFSINIGIHYTHDYYVPYNHWNYVQYNNFCNTNVYNYYVAPKHKYRVHNRTKMRTNYSYYDGRVRNDGVDYDRIRERSGRTIEKRNIVSVNDPRELSRDRDSKDRNREIRTYFANPDDMSRDALRDVKVEKKERNSSLELSKVELGRERTLDRTNRTDNRKIDDSRKIEKKDNERIETKREKTDQRRKVINNDENRNSIENNRKVQERKEIEKRNSEVEKRNNDQLKRNEEIKRSEEVKRNEQNRRNEQVELQRKANDEMKKQKEVTVNNRKVIKTNTDVNEQNSDRVFENRTETQKIERQTQNSTNNNTSVNRNTEVRRNETNNRTQNNQNNNNTVNRNTEVKRSDTNTRTQTKENTRTSDKEKRTKSR